MSHNNYKLLIIHSRLVHLKEMIPFRERFKDKQLSKDFVQYPATLFCNKKTNFLPRRYDCILYSVLEVSALSCILDQPP